MRVSKKLSFNTFEDTFQSFRNLQLAYIMVEREEIEVEDPWGEHQLPPDILPHTVR